MVLLATADNLLLPTSDLVSVADEMEWVGSPLYIFLHSATTTLEAISACEIENPVQGMC